MNNIYTFEAISFGSRLSLVKDELETARRAIRVGGRQRCQRSIFCRLSNDIYRQMNKNTVLSQL